MLTLKQVLENPALYWLLSENYGRSRANVQPVAASSLGMDGRSAGTFDFLELAQIIRLLRDVGLSSWRGLDLSHVRPSPDRNFGALELSAALDYSSHLLTQQMVDFLTCKDMKDSYLQLGHYPGVGQSFAEQFGFNADDFALARAFAAKMLEEAQSSNRNPIIGAFVLEHTPLELLDNMVHYETLRLIVLREGIFISVVDVKSNCYVTFFWNPSGVNTSEVWVAPKVAFAFDVMLSCLWRDACVVRERSVVKTESQRRPVHTSPAPKHTQKLLLPRTVSFYTWVATTVPPPDDLPEAVTTQSGGDRRASPRYHWVKPSYRFVREGFNQMEAIARAESYRSPPPPPGWTFVSPYDRGGGKGTIGATARQIDWRGANYAALALTIRK